MMNLKVLKQECERHFHLFEVGVLVIVGDGSNSVQGKCLSDQEHVIVRCIKASME